MGVWSAGNPYGINNQLIYSFPLSIPTPGEYHIASGFKVDRIAKEKLEVTERELMEESADATAALRAQGM